MENQGKLGQDPAFALAAFGSGEVIYEPGMSKRFYAACMAMQGLLAGKYYNTLVNSPTNNIEDGFPEPITIIRDAYVFADELLTQENK